MISTSRLTKDELLEVAEAEDLNFQLSLDDPFLAEYWLVMGRLRSSRSAIEESLTFAVDLGTPLSKLTIPHSRTRRDGPAASEGTGEEARAAQRQRSGC